MTPAPAPRSLMLWRGATRRCARCGSGKLFRRWFRMVPRCPRCGLRFEKEQGYWVGAIAMNTIIVGGAFVIIFVIAIVATAPDIPVGPILAVVVPLMILGPLVAYPFSRTLWVAVDLGFLERLGIRWGEGRS